MLKFMTYNILDGGIGREDYILQVLDAVRPDIVLLQEVYSQEFLDKIAHILDMNFLFIKGNSKRHLGLLSRFPIVSSTNYHPFPPIRRALLEAEIEYLPNKRLFVFGVHLLALHGFVFECWRYWEVKVIVKQVNLRKDSLCLIGGDFNAIAPRDSLIVENMPFTLRLLIAFQGFHIFRFALGSLLSTGLIDCFRNIHPTEDGFTLPPPKPNARLDYIFANKSMIWHLKNCYVVREPSVVQLASDHYPVLAEFDL